jgi:UDP-glucose 4-epimerase
MEKHYLIFGGTGSLGRRLIERLLPQNHVTVYSRDEAKHWTIRNELLGKFNVNHFNTVVGDIRDFERVKSTIRSCRPTHIIIAAALKQVDTCELSPDESIKTNLLGTQNVVNAINDLRQELGEMNTLFVSTDKACSPVNVYGMCKAISERVVISQSRNCNPMFKFLAVRYGNVLESRGSIIPLFKYQAENQPHITVTDPNMTRFVMTLDNSVDLILHAFSHGRSGTTWIPRLPAMRIGDIAEIFSEQSGKDIKIIGHRPGEKMHEDLVNESESVRTYDVDGKFYEIYPAWEVGTHTAFTYTSADDVMTKGQLKLHLSNLGIINMSLSQFKGRSIEEIVTQ